MILQLGRTAIVLYLPSLALATVTQFDIVTCILLMGARDPSLPAFVRKIVELFGGELDRQP